MKISYSYKTHAYHQQYHQQPSGSGLSSSSAGGPHTTIINRMSTGKRLAKRSIVGTRVCAPGGNNLWYSGVIQKVKTPPTVRENNCIMLTPDTKYTVRFDPGQTIGGIREYLGSQLIGPGFQNVISVVLYAGQRIYITYNGRESVAEVLSHDIGKDEVCVRIPANGYEVSLYYTFL